MARRNPGLSAPNPVPVDHAAPDTAPHTAPEAAPEAAPGATPDHLLDTAWALWTEGRHSLAADQLMRHLQDRAAGGDRMAELCAKVLQADPTPRLDHDTADRALSAAMAELVKLVEQQDDQIAALLALASPC